MIAPRRREGGIVMKLQNIHEVEDFRKVIHECKNNVYLKSQEGDVFNLKSAIDRKSVV